MLSAYDAHSHRYWHQQLVAMYPQHKWQILALKDRHFAWRMGGNAMAFKAGFHQQLQQNYDLLIATSMTDLSTLRSFYPQLTQIPNLLYFHENQFAYPENKQQQGLLELQLKSILSALSADRIAFNSYYNQRTFLDGVKRFANKMPDGIPADLIELLSQKSSVVPVPIKPDCRAEKSRENASSNTVQVVWNHRWEHDKGPETLLALLKLCQNNDDIKFHIIGQQFRQIPQALQTIEQSHKEQCLTIGYLESRAQYIKTLQSSDIVLSTAYHDFQGIAMLEAVTCGCKPIAPVRLVYPELYPEKNLYANHLDKPELEAREIYQLLCNPEQLEMADCPFDWTQISPFYHQWLDL